MARRAPNSIPSTTQIVSKWSIGGVSVNGVTSGQRGLETLSGVATANELKTALSVTGSGWCSYLICYSASAVPTHTIRCEVTVDGVVVFDSTSNSIASSPATGFPVVDCVPQDVTYNTATGYPIRFNSSLVVKIASSQAGTDYVGARYEYQLT
jgi:hypothetical protein